MDGAEMSEFINSSFAAIDGMILSYSGEDRSLTIPNMLANQRITGIGDGSFMESDKLQEVKIPASIKSIGVKAFYSCKNLVNVYLPATVKFSCRMVDAFYGCTKLVNIIINDIEMDESSFFSFRSGCLQVNGTEYLSRTFPNLYNTREAVEASGARPASLIQNGIPRLFTTQNLESEKGVSSVEQLLDGYSVGRTNNHVSEIYEVKKILHSDSYDLLTDKVSEDKNDIFQKLDKYPGISKCAVFSFDDSLTKIIKDKYYIRGNIKIGYHFWQSVVPVLFNGLQYYIYRRHYLTSAVDYNYIRRDAAVFTENGVVTSRREARDVYAKYKLLSVL